MKKEKQKDTQKYLKSLQEYIKKHPLKRDLSVLSRWSKASESKKVRGVIQKVFKQLYAYARLQA